MTLLSKITEKLFVPDFKKEFRKIKSKDFSPPKAKEIGLYLHIPFCKSLCPYCPYNRIAFNENLAEQFTDAVIKEIKNVKVNFGKFKINSLYIGGGTPTVIGKNLCKIIEAFYENFDFGNADIFIETSPYDVTEEKMKMLKECGISMVSLGVQSFENKYLKLLGRNYDREKAFESVKIVKKYFGSINIDLMFALPGQTTGEFLSDLNFAEQTGVSQITSYPLFTFPYTSAGRFLKNKKVKVPPFRIRREMFYEMHDFLTSKNFDPVSVWGFERGKKKTYSSVTRDLYVGFGPSAGTKTENAFYLNTFSVIEYIKRINNGSFAEVAKIDLSKTVNNYYWLYWRLYETKIPKREFAERFAKDHPQKARFFIKFGKALKLLEEKEDTYRLTKRGMFYVHLLQNAFALNYINKVWGAMMKEPAPHIVKF